MVNEILPDGSNYDDLTIERVALNFASVPLGTIRAAGEVVVRAPVVAPEELVVDDGRLPVPVREVVDPVAVIKVPVMLGPEPVLWLLDPTPS